MAVTNDDVSRLIYASCERLDQRDYVGFLDLCAGDFRYRITAYMPEIGREITLFDQSRVDLETTFRQLPQHLRLPEDFFRQATVQRIERHDDLIQALTSVLVIATDHEGVSRLFAAARYSDLLQIEGDRLKLLKRHTQLQTRDLGAGSHIPV